MEENDALRNRLAEAEGKCVQNDVNVSVFLFAELEAVFESIADPILIFSPEGKVINANSAAVTLFTFNPIGSIYRDLMKKVGVRRKDSDRFSSFLKRALLGEKLHDEQVDIIIDNRLHLSLLLSASPVFKNGSISGAVLTWHDITHRQRMDEALREREERYRIMGETIPYGVWLCDAEGNLRYASPSFLEMIEMSMEEAQEFGWTKRMISEDVGPVLNRWLHCVKTGEEWEHEYRFTITDEEVVTVLSRGRPVRDSKDQITSWVGIHLDITERKKMEEELKKIEWLLTRNCTPTRSVPSWVQPYGDLSSLNEHGEILSAVGKNLLVDIVSDYLDLLETSATVIEADGSYAVDIYRSAWCRFLDNASHELCGGLSCEDALESGKWLCRKCCWEETSRVAMKTGAPVDKECVGGIRIYAVPIRAGNEIVGVVNFGYGDPPRNEQKLRKIARLFNVEYHKLKEISLTYKSRPQFIVDTARSRLNSSARLIGAIVERKRAEIALQKAYAEIEKRVELRTEALTRSYDLLKEETKERIKAETEFSRRNSALESVYAMATTFSVSLDTIVDQAVLSIASIIETSVVALGRVEKNELRGIVQVFDNKLEHIPSLPISDHPCGIAFRVQRSCQISCNLEQLYPDCMQHFSDMHAYVGVPVLNSKGQILGVICALDRNERIFTEYEIHLVEIFARYLGHEIDRKNMERQLLQSQEMKMLGQLTSGVAHEVRNPLNGILAITDAIGKDLGSNPEYSTYIDHIRKQVIRLSDLMRDLLDLGRPIESANLMPTSIMWLISASVNMWQHSSYYREHVVRVKSEKGVETITILADRAKMEQVVINLLENACAHSTPENDITIHVRADDGIASIQVTDRGTGIKPEHFEHLFEPFFTTRKGGTGLGLGIVKRIVESHGGAIEIRNNNQGPGVTAEIRLPIMTPAPADCAKAAFSEKENA